MKTIKLSTQLLILFTTVTILSAVVFGLVTYKNYEAIYRDIARGELNTYTNSFANDIKLEKDISLGDVKHLDYLIVKEENEDKLVYNLDKLTGSFITLEKRVVFDEMISKIMSIEENYYESEQLNGSFFLQKQHIRNNEYIIVLMHENYIGAIKDKSKQADILLSFLGTFVAFAVIIVVGNIILALWSREITKRINNLTDQVSTLGSTGYEKEIVVVGADEISELGSEIEKMRLEIRDHESTKQEMFQNLSHDFKTPITVIKSYAEAIEDGIVGIEDAKIIIEQSDKLENKVLKLLAYNKLEYIDSTKPFEDVNLKVVVTKVIQTYRILLSRFKLSLKLEDTIYKGFTENYITVVSNILDNAIRYAKTKIVITLVDNELSIYNDGLPIEQKYIDELFKPYEKGTMGQFGLGMSIVQKTVNRFGYRLKVENVDKGVRFVISP